MNLNRLETVQALVLIEFRWYSYIHSLKLTIVVNMQQFWRNITTIILIAAIIQNLQRILEKLNHTVSSTWLDHIASHVLAPRYSSFIMLWNDIFLL